MLYKKIVEISKTDNERSTAILFHITIWAFVITLLDFIALAIIILFLQKTPPEILASIMGYGFFLSAASGSALIASGHKKKKLILRIVIISSVMWMSCLAFSIYVVYVLATSLDEIFSQFNLVLAPR